MNSAVGNARLSVAEIEDITGIEGEHHVAQRNRLHKMGIKAEINARREVVCFWSWVEIAALPSGPDARYISESADNNEEKVLSSEELGLRLGARRG